MELRWLPLLLLGCGAPAPILSVIRQCEMVNDAANTYSDRCQSPRYDLADCSKVWSVEEPEGYTLEACLDAWAALPCGSPWPPICPTHWPRAPWASP